MINYRDPRIKKTAYNITFCVITKQGTMRKRNLINCLIIALSVIVVSCDSNDRKNKAMQTTKPSSNKFEFDSLAAKEYGADEYGMKKYVIAFLKKGPNRDLDSAKANELQTAHMKNIGRMADEGKLVLAGPFFGDGDLRGIYIFNLESIGEAEKLTNTDPAIQAGSLEMELKEWYGTAAIMAVNDIHKTLSKKGMTEE